MKIAPRQRQELDTLRETLEHIEGFLGRDTRQKFRALTDRLNSWTAKVAVIGQVKAGKSTFLNAFLGQHDFLPSDVNPWTSVVTNIRINVPDDPITGARFDFFSESDWEEIISGTDKIRKLTEELLPGFDSELLRQQSEEMRKRAERRLGKHFKALLGGQHEYDFFTADLMKRYVCAGPGSDEGLSRESLGRYAALTKFANVYMQLPEFQVPTILTDTPGVNDPFLVRDEITCRSLDQSDVFIMVLSAHQPLTDVDISLIRILAQQESKDVLIYVNRIDELDDYEHEVPRVLRDVEGRLKQAIPELDFTIVCGSAYFAELALRDDAGVTDERQSADRPELSRYLKSRHGTVPSSAAERLELASGLLDIKRALSEMIDKGVGRRQIGQLIGDLRAELNAAKFVTRRERESLQNQVESINSETANMVVDELQHEIDQIQSVHDDLQKQVDSASAQIEKVLNKHWAQLEENFLKHINVFVDAQKSVFEERLFRSSVTGANETSIEIDTTDLHVSLGREVGRTFEKSRASIGVILNNHMHTCSLAVGSQFDDQTYDVSLDHLPHEEFNSTLALTNRTLKVEMISDRGWTFWRKPSVDVDKTLGALRAIAAAELRPAIDKILAAFNEAQVERAEAGLARIQTMLNMIDIGLTERTNRLRQTRSEYEQIARDASLQQRMAHRIQSQMEVLERRLLNLSAIEGAISQSAPRTAKVA